MWCNGMIETLLFVLLCGLVALIVNGVSILNYFSDWRQWWLGWPEEKAKEVAEAAADETSVPSSGLAGGYIMAADDAVVQRMKASAATWTDTLDQQFWSPKWGGRPPISLEN